MIVRGLASLSEGRTSTSARAQDRADVAAMVLERGDGLDASLERQRADLGRIAGAVPVAADEEQFRRAAEMRHRLDQHVNALALDDLAEEHDPRQAVAARRQRPHRRHRRGDAIRAEQIAGHHHAIGAAGEASSSAACGWQLAM